MKKGPKFNEVLKWTITLDIEAHDAVVILAGSNA